jgi:hypothetical protein
LHSVQVTLAPAAKVLGLGAPTEKREAVFPSDETHDKTKQLERDFDSIKSAL